MDYRLRWGLFAISVCAACSGLTGCGSSPPAPSPTGSGPAGEHAGSVGEALTPTTVTVAFPAGSTIGHTVMSGNSSLLINTGSTVGKTGDNLTVASFGSPTTTVTGLATVNGSISSVGPVVVQTLATVTGSVQSAGTVTVLPGGTVKGAVLAKQPFVRNTQSWTVSLPTTNQGNVVLALGSRSLAPGAYGDLNTFLATTLSLRSGTYFFTSFNTSAASTVQLDESGGPVVIYVTGNTSAFGNWAPSGGTNPDDLLLVALGSGEVHIGSPLAGTVVAPNAEVDLQLTSAPHVGQVFAKQVDLWAGQALLLGSFDWSYFCPLGDSDGDGVNDCTDQCPLDAKKTTPGVCGCGVSEKDTDGDVIPTASTSARTTRPSRCPASAAAPTARSRRAPRATTASAPAWAGPRASRATGPVSAAARAPARPIRRASPRSTTRASTGSARARRRGRRPWPSATRSPGRRCSRSTPARRTPSSPTW